jgi:predicted aldo/keto reductase-like oxidoreductase
MTMNRRTFIGRSAAAMAGAAGAPMLFSRGAAAVPVPAGKLSATAMRTLGRSGITTTLLAIGTGTNAWDFNSDQIRSGDDNFVRLLITAHEKGIRFFDMADMYGSHKYMARAAREGGLKREELTYLTKTVAKDADKMREDLDRFRREADTEYFDIMLLHCMTDANWIETMKPVMDVLSEAKAKGIVKSVGVSCHDLGALKEAARHPWVDVMLSRINPFAVRMDREADPMDTPEQIAEKVNEVVAVLKEAHANGKGMIGMKIAGGGATTGRIPESLKFVLNLGCIDAITMGMLTQEQMDFAFEHIAAA